MSNTKKYRPYFTVAELTKLRDSLKLTYSPDSRPLLQYIERFISEIEAGYKRESLSLKPSIEEKLGLTSNPGESRQSKMAELNAMYEASGKSWAPLNVYQISLIQEYRYANDLLTTEEEKEYETKVLGL